MPPAYDYLPYGPPRHGPRRSAYLTECTRATDVSYGDGHQAPPLATQASPPHTHALARALPAIWTILARGRRGPPCTTDPSYRATVYNGPTA
jgi:hypothetical protein